MKNLLLILITAFITGCSSYEVKDVELVKEEEIVLYTDSNIYIHNMHLIIKGNIDGEAIIRAGGTKGEYMKHAFLSKGVIDVDFSGDHYNDTCYILYQPKSALKANISIEYEFYDTGI